MGQPLPVRNRNRWPAGIIATFVVFITGTAGLILLSVRNDVELVRPDYYEQELRHQEQMDQRKRAQALPQSVRVTYDAAGRQLVLALPAAHAAAQANGEIQLYRPSAAGMDRRVALQLDMQGRQVLDATTLSDGLWRIRVTWRVGDEAFAFEEKIVVGAATPKPRAAALGDSQTRNPNQLVCPQAARRASTNLSKLFLGYELRICFGFRISDFGFLPATGLSNPARDRPGGNRLV